MRFLPALLLAFVTAFSGRLSAQSNPDPITTFGTIPSQSVTTAAGTPPIDLSSYFRVPSITGQVVQFNAVTGVTGGSTLAFGTFNVELNPAAAPNTVANFLSYVTASRFTNTIVHRLDKSLGVIQGGGFNNNGSLSAVVKNTAITLETSDTLQNARGTLSMARSGYGPSTPGTVVVTSSSTASKTVTATSAPAGFGTGWSLLGSFVQSISGTTITLAANANQTITSSTSVSSDNNISVTSSSTSSNTVTVIGASLPPGFGPAWGFMGSFVQSVSGTLASATVTLTGNADQTISSPTSIAWRNNTGTSEWFINTTDNSLTLPPAASSGYAVFGRVTGTGMTEVDKIAAFPLASGLLTVNNCTTTSTLVTVNSATLPTNFGPGWTLLGANVAAVVGSFVTLDDNPNQTIISPTQVTWTRFGSPFTQLPLVTPLPADNSVSLNNLATVNSITKVPIFPTAPSTPSVVTFSAVSSVPSLVKPTISGSNLYLGAGLNLTGSATVTVTATDSNGNSVSQTGFNVSVTRKVRDYNSDSNGDLIFQNSAGKITSWSVNSSGAVTSNTLLSNTALGDYKLVATADLNGDSIPDFVFQNTIGQVVVWYLDASGAKVGPTTFISTANLGDWRIVATADINKDGNADLIFQNNAGQIAIWYMNGSGVVTSSVLFSNANLGDWRIKCAADINGDGFADLVFQNNAGQISAWFLGPNGSILSKPFLSTGALGDWKIALAQDINGDGVADLVFQNNIGQLAVWYQSGTGTTTSSGFLSTVALGEWRLH